jgi:general secretion pathway protein J
LTHFYSTNKRRSIVVDNGGFTLIEVVIAVALLSLVMSSVYGIFTTISSTEQRLQSEAELYHQARVIFDRLGRELSCSYLATSNENSAFSASNENNGSPYLAFTSTSAITKGAQQGGLVRLRYELNTEFNKKVGRLLRSSVPLFAPDDPEKGQRLSSQIKQLQWRFYDGIDWQEDWDSGQSNSLPQTVEISITLMNNDHEVSVTTAFDLSLQRIEK